jgi:hypothetical protein
MRAAQSGACARTLGDIVSAAAPPNALAALTARLMPLRQRFAAAGGVVMWF